MRPSFITRNRVAPDGARTTSGRSTKAVTPAWRECSLTRTAELESILAHLCQRFPDLASDPLVDAVKGHLHTARTAAERGNGLRARLTGSDIERARSNLDAAEASLLRLSPPSHVVGQLPSLLSTVQAQLRPEDPRRQQFEYIAARFGVPRPRFGAPGRRGQDPDLAAAEISEGELGMLVGAVRAAFSERLRQQQRVRSFRNVLATTVVVMTLIAVGIGLIGAFSPTTIPLCFEPEKGGKTVVVCPTEQSQVLQTADETGPAVEAVDATVKETAQRHDVFVVEVIGLAAAAVAAAIALRRIRGSSEPYGLPIALAFLKLPLGALTAVLGLLLMRGQFVPGLTALDTAGQIVAWALVFGYAQEVFTQMVDKQAHTVLDAVRGAGERRENVATQEPAISPAPGLGPAEATT